MSGRPRLAIVQSRGKGQDHYWSELWSRVQGFAEVEYTTCPGPRSDLLTRRRLTPIHEIFDTRLDSLVSTRKNLTLLGDRRALRGPRPGDGERSAIDSKHFRGHSIRAQAFDLFYR